MLALAIALPSLGRAQGAQPNRAGLVIQHGDGRVVTICVNFNEPSISGAELLERAGVSYLAQSSGMGAAVCKLDGEGCDYPTEDCFCHCKGADCAYWAYQHLREGRWVYSQIGAAATKIRPGDVDGWAWGKGSLQAGSQPPPLTFEQVCAAVALPPPTAPPPPPTQAQAPPTEAPATEVPPTQPPPTRPPSPTATRAARQPTTVAQVTATAHATEVPPTETPPTEVLPTEALPTEALPPTQPPTAGAATRAPAATLGPAGAAVPTRAGAAPRDRTTSAGSYLAFGALALLLVGGIVAVLLRRARSVR